MGVHMVRMPVLAVRDEEYFWPVLPDERDEAQDAPPVGGNAAVRKAERFPKSCSQYLPGFKRLPGSAGGCPARAEFPGRQIDDAGTVSETGAFRHRPAAGEFDVVGMRPDCQQIEFHRSSEKMIGKYREDAPQTQSLPRLVPGSHRHLIFRANF